MLLSQLLSLHLDLTIKRFKEPELMSKILEAARLVAERKKSYDERAQAIIDGMDGLDSKANQAFERPEGLMAAAEQDFRDLHKVFDAANALSNSEKNDENKKETVASQGSSNSSPEGGSAPVVHAQEPEKPKPPTGTVPHVDAPIATTRPVLIGAPFGPQ